MLSASMKGNELHLKFVGERLTSKKKSFFDPIKRNTINDGMGKKKRTPKAVSVLKEDRQAFGLLAAKAMNLTDALRYPITSVPLAIADPDSSLKFSENKSELRNTLMRMSGASTDKIIKHCSWFIDGMAAIRSIKTRTKYREWLEAFVNFITPSNKYEPREVGLINDVYFDKSVKGGGEKSR